MSRTTSALLRIASLLLIVFLFCLLIPNLGHPPEASYRSRCRNNLKQIMLAMHDYGSSQKKRNIDIESSC